MRGAGVVQLRTAQAVMQVLRKRYSAPAWALFESVSNGTGSRASRWSDALAMSLWPSRGLEVHGFEIKVHRNDVLRELKDPKKADEVARYCDFWWLAVGSASIVKPDELPATWGLLVPSSNGTALKVAKEAKKLKAKALDRSFVAAVLRRASEHYDPERIRTEVRAQSYQQIREELEQVTDQARADEVRNLRSRTEHAEKNFADLRSQFNEVLGCSYDSATIIHAIKLMSMLSGWHGADRSIGRVVDQLEHDRMKIAEVLDSLRECLKLVHELNGATEAKVGT